MALEDTNRQIASQNARAANFSASNEAYQVAHDVNDNVIKTAELAAAWRTLGLTDQEGLALVARQQKLNPAISGNEIQRSLIAAAQDLESQGLGVIKGERVLDPNAVIEYGKDEADLQTLTAEEQQDTRDTKERKRAAEAINAQMLDRRRNVPTTRRDEFRDVYADGTDKLTNERLYGGSDQVPQRVLERRIAPQDRLDTGSGQTRATGSGLSGADRAMQDAFFRMDAAMESDPSLRTPENLRVLDQLEAAGFAKRALQNQRNEGRDLSNEFESSLNQEIQARNAAKSLTPQETLLLERATRGLERMGEVQIQKTGPGKDMVRELPRSTVDTASMPYATYLLGREGIRYSDGDQIISGNWESAIDSESNTPISKPDGLGGLIYDNMYIDSEKNGYPQVNINQNVNLLQSRLQTGIPTKWGTLQNAPTTIRGIADLDQALNSVIALAADNKKALVEMPDAGATGKPPVSKNPGGLEALKQIGYNRPEAQSLFNAVAQLQMFANNQSSVEIQGPARSDVPINFDSPEQMGDFRVDHMVAPIDTYDVRKAMKGLTGENIQPDLDDPEYSPERVLDMAQQNFSGEVMRTDPKTGQVSNSKPPIGGISGNKNYMYNKQGIRNLGDLRYALEQQSLRRDARLKREVGDPVRRQVGKVSSAAEKNITRSLLATERANRDERTPKALPAAGESLGSRESAFMAEQGRRSQVIREGKEKAARAALTQPSGRSPLGPGEWVRASDGNVRVMGQGGIPFNRDGAIAVNAGARSMQTPDPWSQQPGTGQGASPQASQSRSSGMTSLPYGIDTSGPSQGPTRAPQRQQQQASSNGPAQGPVPGSARKQFFDRANYARKTPRYQTARRVGYGVGGGVTGLAGLDALIGNESNNRREQEAQF